jgi:hypothetical protein
MSFLSLLGSLLPTRFVANNIDEPEDVAIMEESDKFPQFPRLPAELRHMVITQALYEHEEAIHRVVLLDPSAYRIFPTKELATMASPLLLVNTEFRSLALKVYTKVDVIDLGAPKDDQYGDEHDWYIVPDRREYLMHNCDIFEQTHDEVDDHGVDKVRPFLRGGYFSSSQPRL